MASFPGVLTPSECFAALAAGADGLKVFPAGMMGTDGLKAIRAVLPPATRGLHASAASARTTSPTGSQAGADGFGLGSSLYKPGMAADEVAAARRATR